MGAAFCRFVSVLGCLLLTGLADAANAELMQTSSSLAAGHINLGAEIQLGDLPNSSRSWLNFHETFGLAGGLDLYARQGVGVQNLPLYLGAGVKWTVMYDKRNALGVALLAGGHFYYHSDGAGLDGTVLIDHRFGGVTAALALDVNLALGSGQGDTNYAIVGALRFGMATNVNLFVEAGYGLSGRPGLRLVSTGLQVTI